MNGTEPPINRPTRISGLSIETLNALCVNSPTVSRNVPKSDVAAITAVAIAMPFVIALVVLPTASRCSIDALPISPRPPDISPMPWALSAIGPNVSIETMTPTVVSIPIPVSAIA